MATPMFEQGLTLEDVLELSADELRDEPAGREIDTKGMSKVEMQKAFVKILFPCVPPNRETTQPVTTKRRKKKKKIGGGGLKKKKRKFKERESRLRFEL